MPKVEKISAMKSAVRFSSVISLIAVFGINFAPGAAAKRTFQTPGYEKLMQGSGPQTNDVSAKTARSSAINLSPLKLGELEAGTDAASGGPVLKSTVTATGFAPKGPVDPASKSLFLPSQSVSDRLGGSVLQKAKNVNVMPLPLLESAEETQKKVDTMLDAEKGELADLWESTLTRSPDIQFVVQKLMPSSKPGHASTVMMRMLSSAIFGAMGAANMVAPNMGMYAANSMGTSVIMNLLQLQESKNARNARLSQTESIMLYNMVRGTADKLVENYRNYKKSVVALNKAAVDLQDLQNMVADVRGSQDAAKQVEMEYTIRKAQRDIDTITDDARKFRQGLIDLAGGDSVAKLDKQIDENQMKIEGGDRQTASAPGSSS